MNEPLNRPNAYLIDKSGKRQKVNITPEAAQVWTRYGLKVEWMKPVIGGAK
jgi:hypothetical protein